MELRFSLNGTVVTHPEGWRELALVIERDRDLFGLVNKYTSEVIFVDDGYDKITDSIRINGYCEPLTCLVQISKPAASPSWETLIEGIIFPTECNFDRSNCTVGCVINDNSYISKIQNNKRIKAHIDVGRSKNDLAITAAVGEDVDFFTPVTGFYDKVDRKAYSVNEVLQVLVDFMTDGTVDYISSAFAPGGDYEFWFILTGKELRLGGRVDFPYVSFADVMKELNKKAPIGFGIEDNNGVPRIRIEKKEYFLNETGGNAFTARNIHDLSMAFRKDELYTKIRVGGSITQDQDGVFQYPDIPFYNFKEEEYHLVGECNVDNELDLVGDWIVDSNVIEDILVNGNEDYDEDIVLVMTEAPGGIFQAVKYTDFIGYSGYVYNIPFTNQGITERFIGFIPESIAQYLSDDNDSFLAQRLTTTNHTVGIMPTEEPGEFTNEISDPNARYTAASSFYTIPVNGFYRFSVQLRISNIVYDDASAGDLEVTLKFKRYADATFGSLLNTITEVFIIEAPTAGVTLNFDPPGFYADTPNVVRVSIDAEQTGGGPGTIDFDITSGAQSFFTVDPIQIGGGIVQVYDPDAYHIYDYTTEGYPMSLTEWQAISSDPSETFLLNMESDTDKDIITFADRVTYRPIEGNADLQTFGKYNKFE